MTRQRMFLDMSCVDAARERIRHVYDTFDTVCVQFSGGKDSTAVLLLAKEVHEERGLGPVKVIFRDEEMVSPTVVEYAEYIREQPWVEMEWYCLPMGQEVWILGRREYALLWSPMREADGRLVRPFPEWAIRAEDFGLDPSEPLPESVDYYTMQGKKGMTAFLTGVRANESMIRYRSCVQKLHENYIVQPYKLKKSIPLRFAKPIYDWTTNDVLKFITVEHGAPYCEYYDLAAMTKSNSRVGIPLHSVAIRRIGDAVATEPEFYDRLIECFPDVDAQRRLWPEFDVETMIDENFDCFESLPPISISLVQKCFLLVKVFESIGVWRRLKVCSGLSLAFHVTRKEATTRESRTTPFCALESRITKRTNHPFHPSMNSLSE